MNAENARIAARIDAENDARNARIADEIDAEMDWQDIIRYPNYQIRMIEDGIYEIRSPERLITQIFEKSVGYFVVKLRNANGRIKKEYIHRIIALQYIPNPFTDTHTFVNHKNHDRTDNRITNLEWVTPKQNSQDKGFYKGVEIEILIGFEFWNQHPNALWVHEHNHIRFNNLLYCPDGQTFYIYLQWNHSYHRCTTCYRNGNRYIKARDINGRRREIHFSTFLREFNA
jgi:hypothetical protein